MALVSVIPIGPWTMPKSSKIGLAGHLAVAVQVEEAAVNGARVGMAAREDDGDSGAHVLALDQRLLADLDAGHIGDGVERSGRAFEGDAEVACAGLSLRGRQQGEERERDFHGATFTRPDSIIGSSRGMRVSGASSSSRAHLWPV